MEYNYYLVSTSSLKTDSEILYIFEIPDEDDITSVFDSIKKQLPFKDSEYHRIINVFKLGKQKVSEESFSSNNPVINMNLVNFETERLERFLLSHKLDFIHFYVTKKYSIGNIMSTYRYQLINYPISDISISKIQNNIFGVCVYDEKFSKKLTDTTTHKIKLAMLNSSINFSICSKNVIHSNLDGYKNIIKENDFVIIFYSINMDIILDITREILTYSVNTNNDVYFYYVNTTSHEIYEILFSDKLEMRRIDYI